MLQQRLRELIIANGKDWSVNLLYGNADDSTSISMLTRELMSQNTGIIDDQAKWCLIKNTPNAY